MPPRYKQNSRTGTVHVLWGETARYTECGLPTHGGWGTYHDHPGPSTCNAACRIHDYQRRGRWYMGARPAMDMAVDVSQFVVNANYNVRSSMFNLDD